VNDVPDRRDDEGVGTDVSVTRPESSGPATDRVRIVGAEPAGEATSILPIVSREPDSAAEWTGSPANGGMDDEGGEEPIPSQVRLTSEPGDPIGNLPAVNPVSPGQTAVPSTTVPSTELPHWTEPPTGQVPAVLARDGGDDPSGSAIRTPSWREEDADWVAHDEEFEPSMFGHDDVALGSLDETDSTDAERRPWEFDLDTPPPVTAGSGRLLADSSGDPDAGSGTIAPITEPVPIVPASSDEERVGRDDPDVARAGEGEPADGPPSRTSAGTEAGAALGLGAILGDKTPAGTSEPDPVGAGGGQPDEELFETVKARPTGTARVGRARRNGLLPARMRAKRPDDVDAMVDAPLAAEPPGASVTDVPGAGRKRGGVAGLAAADRSAERDGDLLGVDAASDVGTTVSRPSSEGVDIAATAAAAAGVARRRPRRRSPSDRASALEGAPGAEGPTGGGPPVAPRLRRSVPASGRSGRDSQDRGSSIGLRVGTGIAVAVVALVAFKLGTVPALVLCVVVVTFAAGECFGVLRRAGYHPATLLGLVGTVSLMIGAYSKGVAAIPLVLVLITAFTLVWYLVGIERGSPVAAAAATMLSVGWISLLGAYAGLLLSPSMFPDRHGIAFLLGAIIATVANDVGALVVGGWMGRHPLAPSISPNKTWEGLLGGSIFTVLVSTVAIGAIHPWTPATAAVLGLVVAVVAPIGDLCESLLKRDLRLKDMGTLLPGHGGVLDRVDALLFVLPATYYLVRALNIA
jgi:CDP-diglyceride synthetase